MNKVYKLVEQTGNKTLGYVDNINKNHVKRVIWNNLTEFNHKFLLNLSDISSCVVKYNSTWGTWCIIGDEDFVEVGIIEIELLN